MADESTTTFDEILNGPPGPEEDSAPEEKDPTPSGTADVRAEPRPSDAEDEAESEGEDEPQDGADPEPEKPKAKAVKATTAAGEEMTLQSDTVLTVKVDGRAEQVTLGELLSRESGERTIERRFSDLDRERRTLEAERQTYHRQVTAEQEQVRAHFGRLAEMAKSNRPEESLAYLASLGGQDPVEYTREFLKSTQQWAKAIEERGWPAIEQYLGQYGNKLQREKLEAERARYDKERGTDAFVRQCRQVLAEKAIPESMFDAAYAERAKDPEFAGLSAEQQFEDALDTCLYAQHVGAVEKAIKVVLPGGSKNQALLDDVFDATYGQKLTDEQIVTVVEGVVGRKRHEATKALAERAEKFGRKPSGEAKPKQPDGKVLPLGGAFRALMS